MADVTSASATTPATAASRAATAAKIFGVLDPKNTGNIQKSDFLQLYSLLGGGQSAAETDSFGITATSYNVAPTTYQSVAASFVAPELFLQTSSAATLHASNVFGTLDTDKSGILSKAEFMAGLGVPAPPPDPTTKTPITDTPDTTSSSASDALVADATAQADKALALFDTGGKGYFDEADVVAAFTADPALGDPSTASQTVSAWDDDGDGKVTSDELISGYTTMNLADSLMNQLDPTGLGYIETAQLNSVSLPSLPNAAATIAAWDTDKNGQVSRQEVIDGFHALKSAASAVKPSTDDPNALFSSYDTNSDDAIELSEITAATGNDPANTTDPATTLNAWDSNKDGSVSLTEFTDGLAMIKQATGIIAQYDTAGKGYFDQADLQASLDSGATIISGATVESMMAFWDSNGDGKVTVPEVLAGLATNAIASSSPENAVPDVTSLLSAYGYSATATNTDTDTVASISPVADTPSTQGAIVSA